MKWFRLVLCIAISLATAVAAAGYRNGNDLYRHLTAGQNTFSEGVAYGYIIGVADATKDARRDAFGFCWSIPNGVQPEQLADIVRRYLEQNPDKRQYSAASIVGAAFQGSFPCESGK